MIAGKWVGSYRYGAASNAAPVPFEAEIAMLPDPGEFAGTVRDTPGPRDANLSGTQDGLHVEFIKVYLQPHLGSAPIHYTGTLSEDGSSMAGTWRLDIHMLGLFVCSTTGAWEARRLPDHSTDDPSLVSPGMRRTLVQWPHKIEDNEG